MPKYTHYITVPVSLSVSVVVETDEEIRNDDHAYAMAMGQIEKAGTRFDLENEPGYRASVEIGDEVEFHKHMNRGNVCVAVCSEIDWETEGGEAIHEEVEN